MNNFEFLSPTKLIVGHDVEKRVGEVIKSFGGTKVLVHYDDFGKKCGLVDAVCNYIKEAGLDCVELDGVVYTGFVDWEGHFVINDTDSLTAGNYDNVVLDFVSDDGNYAGNMTVSFIIMDVPTIDDVVVSGNYSETVSFNMTVHNAQSGDIVVL